MNDRSPKTVNPAERVRVPRDADQWHDLPEAIKLGDVCYQSERYGDALEAYSEALKTTPRSQLTPDLRARLHYRIAGCHLQKANYRSALEHLDLARSILPRHLDKVRLAKIYARRGSIMQEMGQYNRALRYLEWARKLVRGTDEHEELAQIENRLGHVLSRMGRNPEARDCFLSALATYRRIDHRMGEANALNNLAILYKNACDFREAVRYLEMARGICERIGYRQRLVTIHINLGIVCFKLSKWELCEEHLSAAEALALEAGSRLWLVKVRLAQGNLALRRRLWDRAESLYREALGITGEESYAREHILAHEFLGELTLARGDAPGAAVALEAALEQARALAPAGDLVYEILRRLGEARLLEGRLEDAQALCEEAAASASRFGDRYEEAIALRGVALVAFRQGRREDGGRVMRMGLETLGEIGDSYQKGLTHLEYGRELARIALDEGSAEDFERAAVQLQRAYGAFLDLDARALAARAAFERARLEVRSQRFEESAAFLARAREVLSPVDDPELSGELAALGKLLEDTFAERWATGGDMLASLREMKRLFQGASDTDAVLRELIRLAVTRSRSSRGCVVRVDEGGGVSIAGVYGWEAHQASRLFDVLGSSLEEVLRENRPVWIASVARDERFRSLAADPHGVRSFVVLPFNLPGEETGLLYVDQTAGSREPGYHQGELHFLTILANLAALSEMERVNSRLARENEALRKKIAGEGASRFITANPSLLESLRLLQKIADSPVSILVVGETGTGKGLLAQVLHEASNRRERPFVQINCAALPEQLLESELFGHVKGAFTGATYNKVGLFQEADGGTLFLDEVDKTSPAVQAKLLHVMDQKEVRPVGSVKSARVDTRVICATNSDLKAKIAAGEFLEDLYYRLNDFTVRVPPLRERREDIPLLLDHFLKRFSAQYGRPGARLAPEVRQILLDQDWAGNVRELEKVVRRLVVLSDEDSLIGPDLLPPEIGSVANPIHGRTLREELARTERRVISDALAANGWNRSAVSRELKISYPALLKKIKDYGLREPAARS